MCENQHGNFSHSLVWSIVSFFHYFFWIQGFQANILLVWHSWELCISQRHNSLTGGPEAPIGPMAPVGPVSPLGPLGPRSPLAPGWPAAPCGQKNRQNEDLKTWQRKQREVMASIWGKCKQNLQGVQQIHWDLQDQAHHVHPKERTKRNNWLEWSLKGQFSEHHVFDTGIIVEMATYRDTTGTSRTSRTSRTSFSLKESTKHFDTGKWLYCSQNRNAPVVQLHIVRLLGSLVQRMVLKMLLFLIHSVLIISNDVQTA